MDEMGEIRAQPLAVIGNLPMKRLRLGRTLLGMAIDLAMNADG